MIFGTLAAMDLCARTAHAVCTIKKVSKATKVTTVAAAELVGGAAYYLNEKRKQNT